MRIFELDQTSWTPARPGGEASQLTNTVKLQFKGIVNHHESDFRIQCIKTINPVQYCCRQDICSVSSILYKMFSLRVPFVAQYPLPASKIFSYSGRGLSIFSYAISRIFQKVKISKFSYSRGMTIRTSEKMYTFPSGNLF